MSGRRRALAEAALVEEGVRHQLLARAALARLVGQACAHEGERGRVQRGEARLERLGGLVAGLGRLYA